MTDPSQMPRWAADILRSTCESAAATLAAHGHLDADAAREFVSGLAAGFEVDADDVACALGLDDLELGDAPVGARPPAEADPPWLDLLEPPPGYALERVLVPAVRTMLERLRETWPASPDPLGERDLVRWTYCRPGEAIAEAAKRCVADDEKAAHAAAWSDHQLAADPPDFRVVPLGPGFVPAEMQWVQGAPTWFISAAFYAAEERRAELEALGDTDSLRAAAEVEPRRLDADEARAAAWRRWHGDNAEVTHDMLLLAGEWESDPADDASKAARIAWILGWSLRERGRVGAWAAAVHVHASDHDDVRVPARPACLDVGRPA